MREIDTNKMMWYVDVYIDVNRLGYFIHTHTYIYIERDRQTDRDKVRLREIET